MYPGRTPGPAPGYPGPGAAATPPSPPPASRHRPPAPPRPPPLDAAHHGPASRPPPPSAPGSPSPRHPRQSVAGGGRRGGAEQLPARRRPVEALRAGPGRLPRGAGPVRRLTCRAGGEQTVAIRSSKLVVPTVTKTDFMAGDRPLLTDLRAGSRQRAPRTGRSPHRSPTWLPA